jgi:hypothetical protein
MFHARSIAEVWNTDYSALYFQCNVLTSTNVEGFLKKNIFYSKKYHRKIPGINTMAVKRSMSPHFQSCNGEMSVSPNVSWRKSRAALFLCSLAQSYINNYVPATIKITGRFGIKFAYSCLKL